jgi:mono/diheme cytochrome c family protein
MNIAKLGLKYFCVLFIGLLIPNYAAAIDDAVATDGKPYQIIDGNIDKNTFEGWRTYNGGGCGQCHGPGGIGDSGKNLAESPVIKNNDKVKFVDYVTNGVPNTLMKPNRNDGRVMKNLDNLFSYLKARSDGALGPKNLIKFPLGK